MDCRETRTLLTAFHDGELPGPDRTRVEEHLGGCPGCGALLADLARADAAAGVPDPGPGYWDRFNARVADRIEREREAEGRKGTVLRPGRGWVRQQLRYLVPAVAAAALVVVVVRYGALVPGGPTTVAPPAVREPAAPESPVRRMAKEERESPSAKKEEGAGVARRVPEGSRPVAGAPAAPPPAVTDERIAAASREERDRSASPAGIDAPSPPPVTAYRSATAGSPPVAAGDGSPSKTAEERKKMADAMLPAAEPLRAAGAESADGMRVAKEQAAAEAPSAASLGKTRAKADPSPPASASPPDASPCGLARALAAQGRLREAETAQRACLAQDRSAPAQEKGLVLLAELLDRQERYAEADAVITEVHRQFPRSRPLDLYRQQRPMVQKRQVPFPVTR